MVVVLVVCLTTVVGTKARLLKSAAAGVISGMLCLGDPTTVLGTDMPLLDDLNVVQAQLRKVRREEDNTSAIFKQLEYLLNNFQLPSKIQYTINSVAPEGRACAITTSGKLSNDLRVITEYYSVFNDGDRNKMMISDSYPGEKLAFIRLGLQEVDQDFVNFFLCYGKRYPLF